MWIFFEKIGHNSNNVSELEGLIEGIMITSRKYILPLIAEGESQRGLPLETKILDVSQISNISLSWILEDGISCLASHLNQTKAITFHHVKQKANSLIDCLANEGVISHQPLKE